MAGFAQAMLDGVQSCKRFVCVGADKFSALGRLLALLLTTSTRYVCPFAKNCAFVSACPARLAGLRPRENDFLVGSTRGSRMLTALLMVLTFSIGTPRPMP